MGLGYQATDRNAFDYHLWSLPKVEGLLRGPRRWRKTKCYVTFVGAAQTFGRFTETPFPEIVSRWLRVNHLNFGFPGAGPEYFIQQRQQALLDYVNGSAACFLQIMSGRSVSTSLMRRVGYGGMLEFTEGPMAGRKMMALDAYRELIRHYDRDTVLRQVSESRDNWTSMYRVLLAKIKVPVILLWMSKEKTARKFAATNAHTLLGEFPQLIDENCVAELRALVSVYVDSTYPDERPQLLLNITTRKPEAVYSAAQFPNLPDWVRYYNTYYPTPRMHEFTALCIVESLADRPDLLNLICP